MPRTRRLTKTLAIFIGDAPPTEFRLFEKGWNETENGKFLFDDAAAKAVMSAYKSWGVDLAIDLEHQMLGDAGADPTARDARGWCRLELRPDGSLWAVNVKWTPDGLARLSEKRQRYVSPAFEIDPDTQRVTKMVNVAITAMPATHKTPALVAASARGNMDPALVMKALDALEAGDAKGALEILKNLIATAAGAEATEEDEGAGSEGDGAEGQPTQEKVEEPKVVDAAAPEMGADDGADKGDDEKDPSKKAAYKAARVMLRHMTGKAGVADQLAEIELWRTSHVTLSAERAKLAKERAALEAEERRALCVSLIKLGAEFPATVWADDSASKLQPHWLSLPLVDLRGRVKAQKLARAPKAKDESTTEVKPPNGSAGGAVVQLSAEEMRICQEQKCDPKVFAGLKAYRDGKRA